jgi:hypothetical protein
VRRQNSEYRIKEDSELQTQNSENGIWVKVFAFGLKFSHLHPFSWRKR